MNRHLRVLMASLLLSLAGCDYLPSWVPGAKPEKAKVKTSTKIPKHKSADENLPIEQQILKLQEEIEAVEAERRKLEQRRNEIQGEKAELSELLQNQETDLQRKEREMERLESTSPAGG